MADHPLILKDFEVRAILDGRKSQKRVALNPQPLRFFGRDGDLWASYAERTETPFVSRIAEGDLLWVREPWRTFVTMDGVKPSDLWKPGRRGAGVLYEADDSGFSISKHGERAFGPRNDQNAFGHLRSGVVMPKWASRLTLRVTAARVERLQAISEADALAEGIICKNVIVDVKCYGGMPSEITGDRYWNGVEPDDSEGHEDAIDAYAVLWDHINGTGAWSSNPWVLAFTFSVVKANIDHVDDEAAA